MNEILVREFWLESVLPGIRDAIKHRDIDDFIKVIVNRADRDTMTGGRFNTAYSDNHDEYKDSLQELISQRKSELSSKLLIETMCRQAHEGVTVGLIQKLVICL